MVARYMYLIAVCNPSVTLAWSGRYLTGWLYRREGQAAPPPHLTCKEEEVQKNCLLLYVSFE